MAAGAAAAAGAGWLTAALPGAAQAARPTRASTKVTIVWAPWASVSYSSTLVALFEEAVKPFLAQNPGLRVVFSPAYGNGSQLVANVLSGQAPDLSSQYQFGPIKEAAAALDLTPYVKSFNLDLTLFSPGRLAYWTTPQGLFGIPSYTNVYGTIINLGILDGLGVKYPAPDWTYHDALALWRAATVRGGKNKIVGGKVMNSNLGSNLPSSFYMRGFGAYYQDPTNTSRCGLDTPEAIACGEFWYGAILDGIASTYGDGSCFPWGIHDKQVVVDTFGTCDMPQMASNLGGIKWDLWLMPQLPAGRFTTAGPDSYVIAANSKHPRETFELLYWVAVNPSWQRWQMRTLLGGPFQNKLWPEYTQVLQQVAPVFRGKNLAVIGEASPEIALRGTFAYADDSADNILNKWGGQILAKKVGVAEAFKQAAAQVNALEQSAQADTAALNRAEAATASVLGAASRNPQNVTLPAPATTGSGTPATAAAKGAVTVNGSVYTIVGQGGGIAGTGDGCTFFAVPWRNSRGSFSCRIVSVSGVGGNPSTGAKFGLMARGDLSDAAPTAAFEVAIDRGVHFNARPMPLMAEGDQQPAPGNGLAPAASVLAPSSQSAANYLLKPIWLRLVREVEIWTGYTSFDGSSWTPAGNAVGIQMAGAWIGLFATPHASPGKIRVVFDHLSFLPTTAYQIGG